MVLGGFEHTKISIEQEWILSVFRQPGGNVNVICILKMNANFVSTSIQHNCVKNAL